MNAKDKNSTSPPPSSNEVQVHLVVHQQNEDLKIDFSFDKVNDDIDSIVCELIETLGMTEADKGMIKSLIEQQINPATSPKSNLPPDQNFEPIAENPPSDQSDDSSDDNDITDPEYRSLIEQQRRDIQSLLVRHLSERRELAQRIQVSAAHQQPQVNAPPAASAPPNPPINFVTPPIQKQAPPSESTIPPINPPANPPSTLCDDLIVFDEKKE